MAGFATGAIGSLFLVRDMSHAAQGLHGSLAEAMAAVMCSYLLKYGGDFFRPPSQH
jgi:hypothetical protein